jgi:hypothetical protein
MRFVILASAVLLSLIISMLNTPTAFVAMSSDVYLQCTCPKETAPEPRKLHQNPPNYEFSWISDADQGEGGRWCYFTGFKNLHPKYVVSVDFPKAEIRADVPPDGKLIKTIENGPSYVEPISSYPFYYTPARKPKLSAGLIKPQEETAQAIITEVGGAAGTIPISDVDKSKSIVTAIRYDVRDPKTKKDHRVAVTFSSSVEGEAREQRYVFSMVNQGKDTLRFQWEVLEKVYDRDALEAIVKAFQQGDFSGFGIELKPGQPFEIKAPSGSKPAIALGVIKIYRDTTFLASGLAPAYFPRAR